MVVQTDQYQTRTATAAELAAEAHADRTALVVVGLLILALLFGLACGYYAGAIKCESIIKANTEVAK